MAKKKPAAKLPVKKQAAKPAKKPQAKASPKKVVPKMAKKTPAKKAVPAKKAAPKKAEKPTKSLAKTVLKAASKFMAKKPVLTKEQERKLKEKEKALAAKEKAMAAKDKVREKALADKEKVKEKALAAKDKDKVAKDKERLKEQEKKQKEQEKLQAKADKAAEIERIKAEKKAAKNKGKKGDDDEEGAFGEEEEGMSARPRKNEDDEEDEFLEYAKKGKAVKKTGKKAYEDDTQVDLFAGKPARGKYNNNLLSDIEGKIADEIAELREHFNWKDIAEAIGTMDFFIDAKNDECVEKGCDNIRTTQSYCRLHYLRNWKVIQKKRDILKEGKLQEYIEELISKYPTKYIEALLSDLSDDKEFYKVLNELNITSEFDFEEDEFENAADDDDDGDDIGIETISSSLRYEDE